VRNVSNWSCLGEPDVDAVEYLLMTANSTKVAVTSYWLKDGESGNIRVDFFSIFFQQVPYIKGTVARDF
jgi:hypothetical protein